MPEPISLAVAGAAPARPLASPIGRAAGEGTPSAGSLEGVTRSFREVLASVARSERVVDLAMRRVARGADLGEAELLAVQTAVYRASREAELVARAVDRVSDTVREVTQVKV